MIAIRHGSSGQELTILLGKRFFAMLLLAIIALSLEHRADRLTVSTVVSIALIGCPLSGPLNILLEVTAIVSHRSSPYQQCRNADGF